MSAPAAVVNPENHPTGRGPLRHRDFRLLWTGHAVSSVGSSVTSVALPLVAVAVLGASTFQVAVLAAAAWVPWLVVGLPAGAWVDRLPRRPVMICCDLVSLVLVLSVPAAAWLDVLTVGQLLVVAVGAGTASVFFRTADQVYLPTLLRPDELPDGNARLYGTEAVTNIIGPGVAGLVAQLAGVVNALVLDALSFLVSAICLLRIRTPEPAVRRSARSERARPDPLRRQIAAGLRFVAGDPYLRVLTVFGAASNLGLTGYQALLVVFLIRDVGLRPGLVGALFAVVGVGAVLGAAVATRIGRRFGTARALLLGGLLAGPPALLIPLTGAGPRLAWLVGGAGAVGLGVAIGNVIKGSFRQTYTPHHLLGRVTVSMQLLNFGTIPLGALLAGALGSAFGPRAALWLMTGWLALTGLILLAGPIRRRRDLPAAPQPGPADPAMAVR